MSSRVTVRSWRTIVRAVVVRPRLWTTAVGQVFRLSPTGWWRRSPFVPRPDPAYLRFRVETQYGGGQNAGATGSEGVGLPEPHDVVEYLEWCRALGTSTVGRPERR